MKNRFLASLGAFFIVLLLGQPIQALTPVQKVGTTHGFDEHVSAFLEKFNRLIRFERAPFSDAFMLPKEKELEAKKLIEEAGKALTTTQFKNFLEVASDNLAAENKAFKWVQEPENKVALQRSPLQAFIESLQYALTQREEPTIKELLDAIKTDNVAKAAEFIRQSPELLKELKKYLK